MTIRIGLIGAGKWGKNHAKNFKRLHKDKICNFVGIADPNPDVRLFANEIEVEYYEDYKELIGHVDAISIAVPTGLHYKIAKYAIKKGKNVLVEKPLTDELIKSKELLELAEENNVLLRVGYIFRHNAAVNKIKEILPELGNIQYISARYIHSNKPPRKDSGVVFNFAIHLIDILNYIIKENPVRVSSKAAWFLSKEREDVAFISLRYKDGSIANLEVSWLHPEKKRDMWIICDKAKLYVDLFKQEITKYPIHITPDLTIRQEPEKLEFEKSDPLYEELKSFSIDAQDIENGDNSLGNNSELIITKICELSLASARTGKGFEIK